MRLNDMLLEEFDTEVKKTRTTLQRVPTGKGDFAPHEKSMPLGKLRRTSRSSAALACSS